MTNPYRLPIARRFFGLIAIVGMALVLLAAQAPALAQTQVTGFKQAVVEAASADDQVAAFYRSNGFQPLWTGEGDRYKARRAALMQALAGVGLHGLPPARYQADALKTQMRNARTARDLGLVEVALSRVFVKYARDVQKGMLVPSSIDEGLVRKVVYRDRGEYLSELAASANPGAYMRALPPATREYRALMKEKLRLEAVQRAGGWGEDVPSAKFEPGMTGEPVVALRNRLINMGFMAASASGSYDVRLEQAVQSFQLAHGLEGDGVAGKSTIDEINKPVATRLKAVIVALERERWLPADRGARHILVNLADFYSKIIDDGLVTFRTRSVIGKNTSAQRSPEFSDVMDHMVINPSWFVPRSIVFRDFLPQLQRDPNAVSHLRITDRQGQVVNRSQMDFSQFSRSNFPFSVMQPPSNRNAMGLVKFMFPNKYNIYLHDTPHKNLFSREVRAYSHGCVRLADPFDFAYALLAPQSDDPREKFHSILNSGRETRVNLDPPVPVHLIYRTAFTTLRGGIEFRRDIYGRDARIWDALYQAGVELPVVQG